MTTVNQKSMVNDGKWWLMMVDNGEEYGMTTINGGFHKWGGTQKNQK